MFYIPTLPMLSRIASRIGKCGPYRTAIHRSLNATKPFQKLRSSIITQDSLTHGCTKRLAGLTNYTHVNRRYLCTQTSTDPQTEEIQQENVEDSFSLSDAYHSLSPEDKHKYNQRRAYNREMSSLRKQSDSAGAVEIYKRMVAEKVHPDHYTYTQVLNMYALLKRPTSAENVFGKIESVIQEMRQDPNWNISKGPREMTLPTLNAMIHVYANASNITKAMELYEGISSKYGLVPNEASLQPILLQLALKNDISAVERLYFDFKLARPDWGGSLRIYTLLIDMYGKARQYHNIATIFEEMKERNIKLDPQSIRVLLRTIMTAEEKISSDLVLKLQQLGLIGKAFSALAGDLTTTTEALTLLASMKASDVPPDILTFNTLIAHTCKDLAEARDLVKVMENEYGIKPNAATYDSLLLKAVTPASPDKIPEVASLTKELSDKGILANEMTYCLLIRFYSQIGQKRKAEELLEQLRGYKPLLSAKTYNAIIRMYSFGGPYPKLMATLQEVQDRKIALETSTVDIMFQSMMRRHHYLDTANMIIHMLHNREKVQMRHILTLFNYCLARAGKLDPAELGVPQHQILEAKELTESRSPGHIVGDIQLVLDVHQVMADTPGALKRAPAEYFMYVLTANAAANRTAQLCNAVRHALDSYLSAEDKTVVFVEFLKLLQQTTIQFGDDIAAWKEKLEVSENRTNPMIQSQFVPFLKYIKSATKPAVTGSRINRPTL